MGKKIFFLLNFSILHLDGLQVVREKHSVYCEILFSVFFSVSLHFCMLMI